MASKRVQLDRISDEISEDEQPIKQAWALDSLQGIGSPSERNAECRAFLYKELPLSSSTLSPDTRNQAISKLLKNKGTSSQQYMPLRVKTPSKERVAISSPEDEPRKEGDPDPVKSN